MEERRSRCRERVCVEGCLFKVLLERTALRVKVIVVGLCVSVL